MNRSGLGFESSTSLLPVCFLTKITSSPVGSTVLHKKSVDVG